jgi:hypothetical protein
VFTFSRAGTGRFARSASWAGAAFALTIIASAACASAQAQEVMTGGCVGTWHSFNCATLWAPSRDPFIRHVPPPADAAALARARERDRRWVDRCRPILTQDRYGVLRYHYAMPGCEFGVGED